MRCRKGNSFQSCVEFAEKSRTGQKALLWAADGSSNAAPAERAARLQQSVNLFWGEIDLKKTKLAGCRLLFLLMAISNLYMYGYLFIMMRYEGRLPFTMSAMPFFDVNDRWMDFLNPVAYASGGLAFTENPWSNSPPLIAWIGNCYARLFGAGGGNA